MANMDASIKKNKCLRFSCRNISVLLITVLILVGSLTAYFLYVKFKPEANTDDDNNNGEDSFEIPTCKELTISRSFDEFWDCLVDGPIAYMNPSDQGPGQDTQDLPEFQMRPSKWDSLKLEPKETFTKNTAAMAKNKRFKRQITTSSYKYPNENYTLEFSFVTRSEKSTSGERHKINDRYLEDFWELYQQNTTSNSQRPPPWSYHGHFGPKEWHKLEIEKFLVPINKNISTEDAHKVYLASFTELWDDFTWIYNDEWLNTWDTLNIIEKGIFLGSIYADPNDKSEPGPLPKIFDEDDEPTQTEKEVLTKSFPQQGYYSDFRFYIPPRPNTALLEKNKLLLPPGLYPSLPPPGAKVRDAVTDILNKLEANQTLDAGEVHVFDVFSKFAKGYMGAKQKPCVDGEKYRCVVDFIAEVAREHDGAKKDQSEYSLPLFPVKYPICQDKEPSPIDIKTANAVPSSISEYIFSTYAEKHFKFRMWRPQDGTNLITITFENQDRLRHRAISLTGGATRNALYFETMSVKYGANKDHGSEHKINGRSYGMELQLFFSYVGVNGKQPYWYTLSRQLNDLFPFREKLVIALSILVEVVDEINEDRDGQSPLLFEPIVQAAYEFRKQSESHTKAKQYRVVRSHDYVMRLKDFIPQDSVFYTYRGGLTVPPCFSYLLWSVYEKPLKITAEQYTELKLMKSPGRDDSDFNAENIRTVDDIYVAQENVQGIAPGTRNELRNKRLNRRVQKSLVIKGGSGSKSDIYDYYYDYNNANLVKQFSCAQVLIIFAGQLSVILLNNL